MPIIEFWDEATNEFTTARGLNGRILFTSDDFAALAATVTSFVPNASDPKVNVGISVSSTLPVQIVAEQTATATPAVDALGIVNRVVGLAEAEPVGEEGVANPVFVRGPVGIQGKVDQGGGAAPEDPGWVVQTTDGVSLQQIATKARQDDIYTKLEEIDQRLATIEEYVDNLETLTSLLTDALRRRSTPSNATRYTGPGAGAAHGAIVSGAHTLWYVEASNLSAGIDYRIMVFNAIALPANGTTPIVSFPLPRGGYSVRTIPHEFTTGSYWALSTTIGTLTATANLHGFVRAAYGGT